MREWERNLRRRSLTLTGKEKKYLWCYLFSIIYVNLWKFSVFMTASYGFKSSRNITESHLLIWVLNIHCIRYTSFSFYSDNSCGSPPIVENATIRNKMTRYLSGDTVRYECIKSLDLFGDVEVTCLNGNWTDPPQCKGRVSCSPPHPHFRVYIRDTLCWHEYTMK